MNSKFKCTGCREYFPSGEKFSTPAGSFHSLDCAINHGRDKAHKNKRAEKVKAKKQSRKAVRELNRRDVRWQKNLTQRAFNRLTLLRELKWFKDRNMEPTCISCQKPLGNDMWACGHYKTVGSNGRLRFDPMNAYLQHNKRCNNEKSGDIENYRKGLIERFGMEQAIGIMDYCSTNNAPKVWDWEELELMRKEFKKEIKQLETELNL